MKGAATPELSGCSDHIRDLSPGTARIQGSDPPRPLVEDPGLEEAPPRRERKRVPFVFLIFNLFIYFLFSFL